MIKVRIDSGWSDPFGLLKVWIYEITENHIAFFKVQSDGSFIATREEKIPGVAKNLPPATFQIDHQYAGELFKALADEINKFGIGTETEAGLRGKIEAKEQHLQDMRKLVFKETPSDKVSGI